MWLIGMMGSGKSTIGAIAAERLGLQFFDTDRMIVARSGVSIPEIWEEMGEQMFRDMEREAVAAVPLERSLAAAGGGAVLDPANRAVIASSPPVVWLRARPETLTRRVGTAGDRPLLDSPLRLQERLGEILEKRAQVYDEVATHHIDTDDLTIEDTANRMVELWQG
jgi:shikimate kinase